MTNLENAKNAFKYIDNEGYPTSEYIDLIKNYNPEKRKELPVMNLDTNFLTALSNYIKNLNSNNNISADELKAFMAGYFASEEYNKEKYNAIIDDIRKNTPNIVLEELHLILSNIMITHEGENMNNNQEYINTMIAIEVLNKLYPKTNE